MENHTCNGGGLVVTSQGEQMLKAMTPEALQEAERIVDFLQSLLSKLLAIGKVAYELTLSKLGAADVDGIMTAIAEATERKAELPELMHIALGNDVHKFAELLNVATMSVAHELAQHAFLCQRLDLAYHAQAMSQELMQKVLMISPDNTEARMLLASLTAVRGGQEGGQQETPQ